MNSPADAVAQHQATVQNIVNLLSQRKVDEAVSACLAFSKSHPEANDALLLLGKARQMQGRFVDMMQLVETALARAPQNIGLQIQFIGACQFCGNHDRALAQLALTEQTVRNDAAMQQSIAQLYFAGGKHADAHRCYLRAHELSRQNPRYWKNLASSFVAMGDLIQAEDAYTQVVKRTPGDYESWYNRSTLRKQTANKNHIRKLEKKLKVMAPDDASITPICYALAKEYEDLGKDERSFSYLKRGATSHRRRGNYNVQLDVDLMKRIAELFDATYAKKTKSATQRRGPIFVLGLPRSGTTLIDRVISSHSEVESKGEISDFALALNILGQTSDPRQLLDTSVTIDPDKLGQSYIERVKSYGASAPYFIDKTPVNYLNIGLIAKALPGATIVHVRRNPIDSCLSMFRALFRTGYPFSYSLDDLAEYFIAYDTLMKHWKTVFPGIVYDVVYEDFIENQEAVSKELVAHCGLAWESACLDFDKNTAPVATASAAQVRKPVYRDALERWRRFETQLSPLIERLEAAGISTAADAHRQN